MKAARVGFSGSGSLAEIHAGAACAILDSGYDIVETTGTSGGSIIAIAVALGMRQAALRALALDTDMSGLLDLSAIHDAELALHSYIDNGNKLYAWLDNVFGRTKLGDAKIPVQVVSTDVAMRKPYVFDSQSTPTVACALAVRASCAVPVAYAPVHLADPKTGRIMELNDGGLMDNMPGDLLASDDTRFGIDVVDNAGPSDISTRLGKLKAYLACMLGSSEDAHIASAKETGVNVIYVPTTEDFLNFNLSSASRVALFNAGYAKTLETIKNLN